jgi:hypothetical protein
LIAPETQKGTVIEAGLADLGSRLNCHADDAIAAAVELARWYVENAPEAQRTEFSKAGVAGLAGRRIYCFNYDFYPGDDNYFIDTGEQHARWCVKKAPKAQKVELSKAVVTGLAEAGYPAEAYDIARQCVFLAPEAQKAGLEQFFGALKLPQQKLAEVLSRLSQALNSIAV